MVRTCSLPCVKKHKADTGCTGQRDPAKYVAMKEFTDRDLIRDINFLDGSQTSIESAERRRAEFDKARVPPPQPRGNRKKRKNAPNCSRTHIRNVCEHRGINLLLA